MATAIINAISGGLGLITELAGNISTAFTGLVVDSSGALTNVATFAFVLMGLGISVGVVKLVFHWLTGRHGM